MKFEKLKFGKVTSTNDIAIKLIKKNKKKSGYIFADEQTKGRGTQGKKWISNKGNLFSSIFFPLNKNYPTFAEFSIINPLIISNVISFFCDKKDISIKWPNDVFVNKKKICGILQEVIISNNKKFLIVGIGINIISSPNINDKYKATNILVETRKKPSINTIINLVINSYENFFINLGSYDYTNFKKEAELMAQN